MSATGDRIEREREVLSTLLLEKYAYRELPEGFTAGHFEPNEYRDIFDKFRSLFIESGKPANLVELGLKFPELQSLIVDITDPPTVLDGTLRERATALKNHQPIQRVEEKQQQGSDTKIDTSQFKPLSSNELKEILGLTIKHDEVNKLITFMAELSAYTEDSQLNISFNAPSSTGKSYIPLEVARLFPAEDVIEVGYCSPTAFFHDIGNFIKEKGGYIVDLSRKILIFLDQPHTLLLQHLRPLLSHDKKEITVKITDKSQKAGLRTKNIFLKGFPSVTFCSAGLKIDEQESTRFLLLSPETSQEKIRLAIHEKIKRETDAEGYRDWLDADPGRRTLKQRIQAIKQGGIRQIKIGSVERINEAFFAKTKILKPRHQRDIARIIGLVKAFALLNLWFRNREGSTIVSNEDDIQEAFLLWDAISESQDLNLPPYVYQLYNEVIVPVYKEKNAEKGKFATELKGQVGLTRRDITSFHFNVYGRPLPDWMLRQQIIPMLEASGLIVQEADPDDKRKMLIYPTTQLTNSQ